MTVTEVELTPAVKQWEALVTAAIGHPSMLGVAFSGGVDSSVLLALAARHLGVDHVLAILAVSASLPVDARASAHRTAEAIGVRLVEVATTELDNPAYVANGPDRCFHCKNTLFTLIDDNLARALKIDAVAYGENADDATRPDRPGASAARDHGVLSPLATAGLTKKMVRTLARELDLDAADTPASPCLASRIPHFEQIRADKLASIDAAEQAVRALGFSDVRVRHHGDIARIELPADEIARSVEEDVRSALVHAVRGSGFRYVTVDLGGIQSGMFFKTAITDD